MLYTFELTESALARIDEYLTRRWDHDCREYILGVQHRLTDDLVFVMIECDEKTATWVSMLV